MIGMAPRGGDPVFPEEDAHLRLASNFSAVTELESLGDKGLEGEPERAVGVTGGDIVQRTVAEQAPKDIFSHVTLT